ncbi:hypothetical protein V8F20_009419 [Naviculisporaceae sp. PSN 640]
MKESVIRSLHDQIRTLSDQVESLKQGQDYRSHYVVEGTPHYVMQQRLANIRLEIQGWARMVLKSSKHSGNGNLGNRPLSDLLASDIPPYELQEGFKGVSPEKAVWHDLRDVKLQDLVAAIASNLIVRDAIVNPLRGCTPQMQEMAESSIYKAMTSEGASPEHRRAAKIWQASCLKYYRSSLQATDNLGTPQEKVEAMERQIDNVTTSVLMALKPVFDVCRLSGQSDSCQRKLRNTIFDATKVGTELAELQSGLVMMDKEWFQAHHTDEDGLISPPHLGSRVDLKLQIASGPSSGDPHDQEGVNRGKLALVLFPGLLKYGNDNGDNWESWTVWIQAKVLVTNVEMIKKETGLPRSQYQKPPPVLEEPGYHVITPGNAPANIIGALTMVSQYDRTPSESDDDDFVNILNLDEEGRNMAGVPEVVIAVMGVTGAGKSTLIKEITGNQEVQVGDGLEACTQHVETIRMQYKDLNLTFLDSPGFNDTYRTDTEVLDDISTFLSETYSKGFRLSGIMYLHPISNARMEGSSLRSLRMFRKLVGEDALSNVLLVSTHWSRVSPEEGATRETDLRTKFWGPLVENGARMARHTGGTESATFLLDSLIDLRSRVVLDIQRELVDEKKNLIDTAAGSALNEEILAIQARYEKQLEETKLEFEEAVRQSDARAQGELTELRRQLEEQIETGKKSRLRLQERERLAAREKQKMQTQFQVFQATILKSKEEAEKAAKEKEAKFEQERAEWRARLDAADRADATARSAQRWSHISDFANSAINAWLVYLTSRR